MHWGKGLYSLEAMIQEKYGSSYFLYKFWVSQFWHFKDVCLYQLSFKIVTKCCEIMANMYIFTHKSNDSNLRCALMECLGREGRTFFLFFI